MRFIRASAFLIFAIGPLSNCTSPPNPYRSNLDPLALQQMQSQEFETSKGILFASTVSVFQDNGFTIENGDMESGILTAKSATVSNDMQTIGWLYAVSVRATAFVEATTSNHAKARLNFIECRTKSTAYGAGVPNEIPNEDPAYYEKIFSRIREAVFLREAYKANSPEKVNGSASPASQTSPADADSGASIPVTGSQPSITATQP